MNCVYGLKMENFAIEIIHNKTRIGVKKFFFVVESIVCFASHRGIRLIILKHFFPTLCGVFFPLSFVIVLVEYFSMSKADIISK